MDEATRKKIAYAVAQKAGKRSSAVYGFTDGQHTHMSGSGNSMYDFGTGSHFSENYDFGRGAHWNFKLNGEKFTGYDFGFGHHFSGSIRGNQVSIYDFGSGTHHNYSL